MTQDTTSAVLFQRILIATDLEPCSLRALEIAASLAQTNRAELFVVHVIEPPAHMTSSLDIPNLDWLAPLRAAAQQSLNECVRDLRARGLRAGSVLADGVAWEQILLVAERVNADLLVLGTHGRRGFAHALIGSVAEKLVRMAPMPVFTVRAEPKPRSKRPRSNRDRRGMSPKSSDRRGQFS